MLLTNIILRNLFAWEIEFSCEHEIPVCKTKLLHSDKKTDETPWYCVVSSHSRSHLILNSSAMEKAIHVDRV